MENGLWKGFTIVLVSEAFADFPAKFDPVLAPNKDAGGSSAVFPNGLLTGACPEFANRLLGGGAVCPSPDFAGPGDAPNRDPNGAAFAGAGVCAFSASVGFDVAGAANNGLVAVSSAAGLRVANLSPKAGVALDVSPVSVVLETAGVPNKDLNGCGSADVFGGSFSPAGLGVANMFPNAGEAAGLFPVSAAFEVAGVPNMENGWASAAFPAPSSAPVAFGVARLANGFLASGASVTGFGANILLAGSTVLGVVLDPKRPPNGFAASAAVAGVWSVVVLGAKILLEAGVCPDRFAKGLLVAPSDAGFGVNRLLTAGCDLASAGLDVATAPKRGLNG